MAKKYTDHLGNEYSTKKEMAEAYGLEWETFKARLRVGKTLKEALTTPLDERFSSHAKTDKSLKERTDHHGNVYRNKTEMANAYKIDPRTVKRRLDAGWTLENALTKPPTVGLSHSTRKDAEGYYNDGYGNRFVTIKEMASYHNMTERQLSSRIARGMSFREAIEKSKKSVDHLGNTYRSDNERAAAYGLEAELVRTRLKRGWSLERALTTKAEGVTSSVRVTDHHGNIFNSITEMADAYGMKYNTLQGRLAKGWSVEDALTIPTTCHDHAGKEYSSFSEMCKAYGKVPRTVKYRLKKGIDLGTALTAQDMGSYKTSSERPEKINNKSTSSISPIMQKSVDTNKKAKRDFSCRDHVGNEYPSFSEMCRTYGKAPRTVRDRLKNGIDLGTALTAQYVGGHKTLSERPRKTDNATDVCKQTSTKKKTRKKKTRKYIIDGKVYYSAKEIEREFGINVTTLSRRLQQGMTVEEAVRSDVEYHRPRNTKIIDHKGREFKNLKEACRFYKIPHGTVVARLNAGWSQEEALCIPGNLGRSIRPREAPVFELNGQQYYNFTCPLCGNVYIFTKTEIKRHILAHVEEEREK